MADDAVVDVVTPEDDDNDEVDEEVVVEVVAAFSLDIFLSLRMVSRRSWFR